MGSSKPSAHVSLPTPAARAMSHAATRRAMASARRRRFVLQIGLAHKRAGSAALDETRPECLEAKWRCGVEPGQGPAGPTARVSDEGRPRAEPRSSRLTGGSSGGLLRACANIHLRAESFRLFCPWGSEVEGGFRHATQRHHRQTSARNCMATCKARPARQLKTMRMGTTDTLATASELHPDRWNTRKPETRCRRRRP